MPETGSVLRLILASSRDEVGRALEEVRQFLTEQHASEEAIDDLCLVVDEVLANVVMHGYGEGASGRILLHLAASERDYALEVRDEAPAYNPLGAPEPMLDGDPDERGIGGLGMHLVRTLMDEMSYERIGAENVLRLRRLRREG